MYVRRLIVLMMAVALATAAQAGPFTFERVSNSDELVYEHYAAPAFNNNGVVSFWANYDGVSGSGIFTGTVSGPVERVADTSLGIADFGMGFSSINDSGQVAFWGLRPDGYEAVFSGNTGGFTQVYDTSQGVPGSGVQMADIAQIVDINEGGMIAFESRYQTNPGSGILRWNGSQVEELGNAAYHIGFFQHVSINNAGTVAGHIRGLYGESWQMLLDENGTTKIVQNGLGAGQLFTLSGRPVINNHGQVAFWAREDWYMGPRGFWMWQNGNLTNLITLPNGVYASQNYSFNDLGTLAFTNSDHTALYYVQGGQLVPIIQAGDVLDGRVVRHVFINSNSLNDQNLIAIHATFDGGYEGIYVAAVPEPGTLAVLLGGGLLFWRRRRSA